MKFDSKMNNSYFLKPYHLWNSGIRQRDLLHNLAMFAKNLWKFHDFYVLFKTLTYINTNRHKNFCGQVLSRKDAIPTFSKTMLIILIHPVVLIQWHKSLKQKQYCSTINVSHTLFLNATLAGTLRLKKEK